MGEIHPIPKEKLICGVLLSREVPLSRVLPRLEAVWGPADHAGPRLEFPFTGYYQPEMGEDIGRVYLSFRDLVEPERLREIKRQSNLLEEEFLEEGKRRVNLDPGLLSLHRVILASTKDAGHRIPLGEGIYGEITLIYRSGHWHTLEWTYPDYGSSVCREEMAEIRRLFKLQRRREGGSSGEGSPGPEASDTLTSR